MWRQSAAIARNLTLSFTKRPTIFSRPPERERGGEEKEREGGGERERGEEEKETGMGEEHKMDFRLNITKSGYLAKTDI